MTWVAASIAGGAVLGAVVSGVASSNAANAETNAANQAAQVSEAQYEQTRADQAPWRAAGSQALGTLQTDLPSLNTPFSASQFVEDPGYQFSLDQGEQAIERSAAARGGLDSGATMKSLSNYAQGAAGSEYQAAYDRYNEDNSNTFNRLASVAGLGQTSTNATDAAGTAAAGQVGSDVTSAANAQAAGTVGTANAISSGIGNGMNSWMQYSLLGKMTPTQAAAPSYTNYGATNTGTMSSLGTYNYGAEL